MSEDKYIDLALMVDRKTGLRRVVSCPYYQANVGGIVECIGEDGIIYQGDILSVVTINSFSKEYAFLTSVTAVCQWTRLWTVPLVRGENDADT